MFVPFFFLPFFCRLLNLISIIKSGLRRRRHHHCYGRHHIINAKKNDICCSSNKSYCSIKSINVTWNIDIQCRSIIEVNTKNCHTQHWQKLNNKSITSISSNSNKNTNSHINTTHITTIHWIIERWPGNQVHRLNWTTLAIDLPSKLILIWITSIIIITIRSKVRTRQHQLLCTCHRCPNQSVTIHAIRVIRTITPI